MELIVTYVYYKWIDVGMGIKGPDPQQYMTDLHKIVESGHFSNVNYCGQMNCTCAYTEDFGPHYGMIFVANKETTRKMLDMIKNDVTEAFDYKTMEKMNSKTLEKVEL